MMMFVAEDISSVVDILHTFSDSADQIICLYMTKHGEDVGVISVLRGCMKEFRILHSATCRFLYTAKGMLESVRQDRGEGQLSSVGTPALCLLLKLVCFTFALLSTTET